MFHADQADHWFILRWASMTCIASACSGCLIAVLDRTRGMLMAYFAFRCVHTIAVSLFFATAIIYLPQYASSFLLIVSGYAAALVAVFIPSVFFTKGKQSFD
jgi:hypothetical protein